MSATECTPLAESPKGYSRDGWEPNTLETGYPQPPHGQSSNPTPRDDRRIVSHENRPYDGDLEPSSSKRDFADVEYLPSGGITDYPNTNENSSTDAVTTGSPVAIGSLSSQLNKALVKSCYDKTKYFLPKGEAERLVHPESIKVHWLGHTDKQIHHRCFDVIGHICGSIHKPRTARLVFVVLLLFEEPALMLDLLEDKIYDEDLPLVAINKEGTNFQLRRNSGGRAIECFNKWGASQRLTFEQLQWQVTAPVFFPLPHMHPSADLPVLEMDDQDVLPLTEYDMESKYQGNSEVVRVVIHPAHHPWMPEENHSFALKSLKAEDVITFRLEAKALRKIKPKTHLVSVLAAFKYQSKYHLLFRWADGGNLADFWSRKPVPNYETVCWLVEQCYGLADGLDGIHNAKFSGSEVEHIRTLTPPLSPTQTASWEIVETPTVKEDDKDCGRHGDIKPQNILWFKQDNGKPEEQAQAKAHCKEEAKYRHAHGVLKISDFGLTTFHTALTTKVPNNVPVTYTYAAPERDLDSDLSRPFDIWSLGCVYLEFITWFLLGSEQLSKFKEERMGKKDSRTKFITDEFYSIHGKNGRRYATVNQTVIRWIKKLKKLQGCSSFFSDFLDYIQTQMLVVDKGQRDRCGQVKLRLRRMADECERDPKYAFSPSSEHVPWRIYPWSGGLPRFTSTGWKRNSRGDGKG